MILASHCGAPRGTDGFMAPQEQLGRPGTTWAGATATDRWLGYNNDSRASALLRIPGNARPFDRGKLNGDA